MVRAVKCECADYIEAEIGTISELNLVKNFFSAQIKKGIYYEMPPAQPYYVGQSNKKCIEWFATKWYKCRECGCLWEIKYPDFPAKGFLRKFVDGTYEARGY